jgi:hypothetical protein
MTAAGLAVALTVCGSAQARSYSYDYLEGGVADEDHGSAIFAGGSTALDPHFYALGSLYALDFDHDVNGYYLEGGLGYHVPLTAQADFFVNGQLLYANIDHPGDNSDLGAIARAGVRFVPAEKFELEGALAVSSNDRMPNDGVGINVSGRYYFDPKLSVALGLSSDTETDGASLSVRYRFR